MRNNPVRLILLLLAVVLLTGCSVTRYVPEGKLLLDNVRVTKSEKTDYNKDVDLGKLRDYVRQKPNSRWFSLLRLPLATYSASGRDSTKWINRTLRNMGEAPVVYDSLSALQTCRDLRQELQNEGFLNAEVSFQTYPKGKKGKKVIVNYLLDTGEPYYVRNLRYDIADRKIEELLRNRDDYRYRLLRKGMKFDVASLDAERKRITSVLTDNGYYRFHKEYITYLADTVRGQRLLDLTLKLSLYRQHDKADTLHTCYSIRNVTYSRSSDEDASKPLPLRQRVLEECTHLKPDSRFSASNLQRTYNHFGRLQAVKYTNISLRQVADTANLLDCDIQVQAAKPSTISFQPEGTNTAGDLGAAASLTFQNRNLFRGSEVLSLELRGAYEAIKELEGYSNSNFVEYSAEARLTFPRLLFPFLKRSVNNRLNATTDFSVLYDMQNRPEFYRRVLSGSVRYRWNYPGSRSRYQIDLLDLNYVFMPWISPTFRHEYLDNDDSRNAILKYNYEDLFITKFGVGYSYSNSRFAIKTNLESSGNLLSLASGSLGAEKDGMGQYRLFNIAFAQYVKGDIDITQSFRIDDNNHLVLHFGLGVAYPYGNSTVLPFEKRYFSGGANSVRGWSVRSLGPGKYQGADGRINFINQTGDMKLDLNAEYRTHLFWKLGAAFFIDAGNIWTIRYYEDQPGGQFRFRDFLSDLAASYGLGLRFNFDYFILRFDLGMKAVNPCYDDPVGHFPILHTRFSRDYAFHFAVGLPF